MKGMSNACSLSLFSYPWLLGLNSMVLPVVHPLVAIGLQEEG